MTPIFVAMILGQFSWGDPPPTYEDQYAASVRLRKPLVVGVGCPPPPGEWLTYRVAALWHAWPRPCVVVARPMGDALYFVAELPPGAPAADVARALVPSATKTRNLRWTSASNC
jgi:hypothetical protein